MHVRVRVSSGSLTIAESTKGYTDEQIAPLQSVTVNEQSAHDIIGPFLTCAVFHMCLLWKTQRSRENRVQTPPRAERILLKTGNETPAALPLVVENLLVYANDASNQYVRACRYPNLRDQRVEAQQQAPFPVLHFFLASRHDTHAREE